MRISTYTSIAALALPLLGLHKIGWWCLVIAVIAGIVEDRK
jgi:hypothetical protein